MDIKYHTEYITFASASGWVFAESGAVSRVKAICNGEILAETSIFHVRPDVAADFPSSAGAERSGFFLAFDQTRPKVKDVSTVRILAAHGEEELLIGEGLIADPSNFEERLRRVDCDARNALPAEINKCACSLNENGIGSIDFACRLLSARDLRAVPEITRYVRYLVSCWSHFNFVAKCFPSVNRNSNVGEKDYLCKQNSPLELFSIAHHLYVLKSYRLKGAFAEFGCFKGFSSSMLSFACSLLGIEMHIYDSFEGLPQSASSYYKKGDFSGSFEEVKQNIAQFGVIDPVVFHHGYFSYTLKDHLPPPLLALWMDVDLASSASDVLIAAKMLSPLGVIFSHECSKENFSVPSPAPGDGGPNDVVSAILSYYKDEGSRPTGLFLAGCTGAFWRAGEGIPVLPVDQLWRVLQAVES